LIINQGVIPKKVALLPYCLDPGFNDRVCSNHLSPSSQSASVLTVGRLLRSEPGKGVDTVIRAFPKVLQAVPSAEYIIIGDGNHRSYLEQLAKETGVRERVSFLGPQNDDELREHYRKAAVFAMPSRQEGFGIVYLEAMSFAKPVVAAGFGGAPDIVIDGLTGFLIPYGDVDALADRLICLLRNADLRCKLGISGRARVEAHYSFGGFRQQLADLLTPSLPV
jgi:phosphatidylinositol alpha-1,6-mannosyltransferase